VGAGLAESGNEETSAGIERAIIGKLKAGKIQTYKPKLDPLAKRNLELGRLAFTTDVDMV